MRSMAGELGELVFFFVWPTQKKKRKKSLFFRAPHARSHDPSPAANTGTGTVQFGSTVRTSILRTVEIINLNVYKHKTWVPWDMRTRQNQYFYFYGLPPCRKIKKTNRMFRKIANCAFHNIVDPICRLNREYIIILARKRLNRQNVQVSKTYKKK